MQSLSIAGDRDDALASIAEETIRYARTAGADQVEVGLGEERGLTVTARLRDVETIEFQDDRSIGVTVYCERRKGSASTSDFGSDAVRAAVDKALLIARETSADDCAGLAEAEHMASTFPALDVDRDWAIEIDDVRDAALAAESAALDLDSRISNSEGASVNLHRGLSVYANSHGFLGRQRRSRYSISCAVIAGQGDAMQRDYFYTSDRHPERLMPAREVGEETARRTLARLAPRKLSTRTAPVLFSPEMARGLFSHLLAAISGGPQYRRASFYLGALGEQILPHGMRIREQPLLPGGAASAAFDSEGVATSESDIVDDGVLARYLLSSYSARRLGMTTTGNAGGVHNAVVASTHAADALLSEMGTGLLVTELMGQGVNPVTGDYSRGASGFWVEQGQIAHPVAEITIAGNLRDMYRELVGVGDDVDLRGGVHCGSALVASMRIAGD